MNIVIFGAVFRPYSGAMELKRGINFGGWLSQCNHTRERYDTFIGKADVERVADWGFDHIRLPFDYNVIEDERGNDRPEGYAYLDNMVSWCQERGLDLILDLHKAAGYDFSVVGSGKENTLFNTDALKRRFVALWEKVAARYGKHRHVAFELLNEVVEEEAADSWNALIADAVRAIRLHAPDSVIIYGGIQWNSARTLCLLDPPADGNVIFTFHFYEPLIFTHQKAPWVPNMIMDREIAYPGTMAYYIELSKVLGYKGKDVTDSDGVTMGDALIRGMVAEAKSAAEKAGVRLYCGEFGVIDRAPPADSLNWFRDVLSVFRDNRIGCAIWSYKEMDFGLIDTHYDSIRDDLIGLYVNP
jgi:aryl-phospho-beta-D-glucosidase BglC (GH1 family)